MTPNDDTWRKLERIEDVQPLGNYNMGHDKIQKGCCVRVVPNGGNGL